MARGGRIVIDEEIRLSVWKQPTNNDRNIKDSWGLYENNWSSNNYNRLYSKINECLVCGNAIKVTGRLAGVSRAPFLFYETTYTFGADGSIDVSLTGNVRENAFFLPRLGFEFRLPKNDEEFLYYGKGPYENYVDMCHHATVGMYSNTPSGEYVPYIKPQEHGNHTSAKMLSVPGLQFVSKSGFNFAVSQYDSMELSSKTHAYELEESEYTIVRIDYGVSGIGSNSCGPGLIDKYKLDDKEIVFAFRIE